MRFSLLFFDDEFLHPADLAAYSEEIDALRQVGVDLGLAFAGAGKDDLADAVEQLITRRTIGLDGEASFARVGIHLHGWRGFGFIKVGDVEAIQGGLPPRGGRVLVGNEMERKGAFRVAGGNSARRVGSGIMADLGSGGAGAIVDVQVVPVVFRVEFRKDGFKDAALGVRLEGHGVVLVVVVTRISRGVEKSIAGLEGAVLHHVGFANMDVIVSREGFGIAVAVGYGEGHGEVANHVV